MLSQIDTLNNINSRLSNAKSNNDAAYSKQLEFKVWFGNLEWFDKHIDEKTLARAEQYESMFMAANEGRAAENRVAEDSFGAENPDTPTIRRGSKGPAVKKWQGVLGLTGKDQDGDFGPNTERLTKAWQKKNGLKDDGIVGPATWTKALGQQIKDAVKAVPSTQKSMRQVMDEQKAVTAAQVKAVNPNVVFSEAGKPVALTSSGNPILKLGSKGPDVGRWQKIIGANRDDNFGPQTHTLTVAWQKRHGLTADGIVDDPDWAASVVAPKTTVADVIAAAPALEKANARIPDAAKPQERVKQQVKKTVKNVTAATKAKVQSMPLWQRVVTGAAVTGCAIFGFQFIAQKLGRKAVTPPRMLTP